MTQSAPFGSWHSPITPSLVLSSSVGLGELSVARTSTGNTALVWAESRPEQNGRTALVYRSLDDPNGKEEDVLPDTKWNARTRVHEYGGGAYTVSPDGSFVVFSSIEGPLYKVERSKDGHWSEPKQVSPDSKVLRYADMQIIPSNALVAVMEDHTNDTPANVVNTIVAIDLAAAEPKIHTVVQGNDFYSQPRLSPSGEWISYVTWAHPDMPWDGSELWVAKVEQHSSGKLDIAKLVKNGTAHKIAGEKGGKESVSQARWSKDKDELVFLSDRTGFYELYKWQKDQVELVLKEPTGSDVGPPEWVFGNSTHAPLAPGKWVSKAKSGNLRIINLDSKDTTVIETPFLGINMLQVLSASRVAVLASSADTPNMIAILDIDETNQHANRQVVKLSSSASVDSGYVSRGETIEYPTKDGSGKAYAVFYPPRNKDYNGGKDGELPPLITHCHGGPTAAAKRGLDWTIQFFTSRGFAYVDVDYGGSTGYGKQYRQRLNASWGVVDVQDTIACVEYLTSSGKADKDRVEITGGSAGGFTVLASLCDSKVFGAGTSYYGVSDLKLLADDTHKFESQYLFNLMGGTPDEIPNVYRERSPLFKAENITAPMLLLQGSIDKVVPPQQAYAIRDKVLQQPGGKAELIEFEGEGHGFRKAENQKRAMEEELKFVRATFGIEGGRD
ncbi:hypothetical protein OIO90_005517 [Microbotryomycetes sp. JL221]|nr:hypothetical protein OIO90_005517 [Microbotryomycetes sp. JL221]